MKRVSRNYLFWIISLFLVCCPVFDISAADTLSIDEAMSMSLEDLMNLQVITASKRKEKISDIPASVVVITGKEIRSYGYKNTLEVIENIPGMYLRQNYLGETLGIRGFSESKTTAVFLNNVYLNSNVSFIPVQSIDRVEVIRGPMSVVYGSDAFLGAINIITNQNEENESDSGFLSVSGGSAATNEVFGKFRYKHDNFCSTLNFGIFHSSGLDIPYKDLIHDPSRLPVLGVPEDMTTKDQLSEDRLFYNISAQYDNFFFEFIYIEATKGLIYFYPSTKEGSDVNKTINYISLGYKKELFDDFEINVKIDFTKKNRLYDFNFNLSDTNLMGIENAYFSEEYTEKRAIPEINLFWKINNAFSMNLGLYSRIELSNTDNVDIPFWGRTLTNSDMYFVKKDEHVYTNAVYSQLQFRPINNLYFKIGLRAEEMLPFNVQHNISQGTDEQSSFDARYPGSGINIIPQVAAIYSITDQHILKFMYGEAIKTPKIQDIYSDLWAMNKDDVVKNPISSEHIRTFEINYSTSIFNSLIIPSLSLYRNEYDNMIQKQQIYKAEEDKYYWLFRNYAKRITNGIELNVITRLNDNLKMEFSYTYQQTVNQEDKDVPVGNSPTSLGYIKAMYSYNNIVFGLTGNFVDEMFSNWSLINEKRVADAVPAYFNLALNCRINDILKSGLMANFHVSNLLDQEIRYTSNSQEYSQRGYLFAGRTYYFTLGYGF